MHQSIEKIFTELGGEFCSPLSSVADKLNNIKAFVFDWDGVFNNASKNEQKSSTFNEADSMGTNMLRFSHYLIHGNLPVTAIISGEKNAMAFYFSEREHFNASYFKVANKLTALNHLCSEHKIKPHEVCYFFDDVLDLSIAGECGLRIGIRRKSNPLFLEYLRKNKLVDYITAAQSGDFAVREACELLMGINNNYDTCMDERKLFTGSYADYLNKRQSVKTFWFTAGSIGIEAVENPNT